MARLRAHRRDRRARAAKSRRRRNLTKFVPSSDTDFAMTSRNFAEHVWKHREEFGVPEREAEYLCRLVKRFREALAKTAPSQIRTKTAVQDKNDARKEAEHWVRMIGAKIRTDPAVGAGHKRTLRLIDLPPRRKTPECPQRPPGLIFIGVGDGVDGALGVGNGSGVHVLKFFDYQSEFGKQDFGIHRKARPDGATRLELWVGFIPQGVACSQMPESPQEYLRMGYGWPLFLRSYSENPIEARFPMPDRPMLIVYWARWAKENGDHGRFCKTCVARVEGWPKAGGSLPEHAQRSQVKIRHGAQHALPAAAQLIEAHRTQATFLLLGTPFALPADGVDGDECGVVEARRMLPEAA